MGYGNSHAKISIVNFKNIILLTGAGFAKNFGGFLGREMWSKIFNNPRLSNAGDIKQRLKETLNFEDIYSEVFDDRSNFPEHEVEIFEEVVNEAYQLMEDVVQSSWDNLTLHHGDVKQFLDYFKGSSQDTGACFTLNQDLMLEKRFNWQPLGPRSMNYKGTFGNLDSHDLDSPTPKPLPTAEELEDYKTQLSSQELAYIKLHGSLKWVSSEGDDTKVLGINKLETINRIPLLKWYFELFEQALYRKAVKLLIIGYGFADSHINNALSKAALENGLKIYIISPENPEVLKDRITHKQPPSAQLRDQDQAGINIWNALDGYFPYTLRKIFPKNQRTRNPQLEEIKKALNF